MNLDVVKSSAILRKRLKERITEELKLSYGQVVKDAKKHGMTITKPVLSYYFNYDKPCKGYPTSRQILWLAFRYSISIVLEVEMLPYNEDQAIQAVKLMFSDEE